MSQVKSYHNQTILFSYTRQIYEMAKKIQTSCSCKAAKKIPQLKYEQQRIQKQTR